MRKATTICELIEEGLKAHGYDGLVSFDNECGCEIGDLAPCDSVDVLHCEPGIKVLCDANCRHEDAGVPGAWHIEPKKDVNKELVKPGEETRA